MNSFYLLSGHEEQEAIPCTQSDTLPIAQSDIQQLYREAQTDVQVYREAQTESLEGSVSTPPECSTVDQQTSSDSKCGTVAEEGTEEACTNELDVQAETYSTQPSQSDTPSVDNSTEAEVQPCTAAESTQLDTQPPCVDNSGAQSDVQSCNADNTSSTEADVPSGTVEPFCTQSNVQPSVEPICTQSDEQPRTVDSICTLSEVQPSCTQDAVQIVKSGGENEEAKVIVFL